MRIMLILTVLAIVVFAAAVLVETGITVRGIPGPQGVASRTG